jgi:transglutaminase-like putative cysteine protease
VRAGNELKVEHIDRDTKTDVSTSEYRDVFGNRCTRFTTPAGAIRLSGMNVVAMEEFADPIHTGAQQARVEVLPSEVLQFLLPSRYCEVDLFGPISQDLFGWMTPGWTRAAAIRDWVHEKVAFNYKAARPTKKNGDGCLYRADWGLPGLSASRDNDVAVPEYSGAVYDGVSGGYSLAL